MQNNELTKEEKYKSAMSLLCDGKSIENMKQGYCLIKALADEEYDFSQYVLGVLFYDETKITGWTFSTDIFEKNTNKATHWLEKVTCKNKNTQLVDKAQAMLELII